MTTKHPTPNAAAFNLDLAAYRDALNAVSTHDQNADPAVIDALYERCGQAENKLLAQPAPDIGAVADKLTALWDDALWSETDEGMQMRLIVGDLRRLAALHEFGVEPQNL